MSASTHGGDNSVFARAMLATAKEVLGEPNRDLSTKQEIRFGNRGSLSVNVVKGTYVDHEAGSTGGGVLHFLKTKEGLEQPQALEWLQERKLIPEPKSNFNVVAEYNYVDEDGVPLYQVVRLDPKDFRQRRLEGGNWVWKLGNVRRVPYRLPELMRADPSEMVFVVEGEKDVDRLWSLGLVATCNAGGAASPGKRTKWPDKFREFFAGRDVVVLPDNDAAGEQHAAAVADSLTSMLSSAASVRIVRLPDLPEKGDVSDWLNAGGNVPQLRDLVADAPLYSRLQRSDAPSMALANQPAQDPSLGDIGSYLLDEDSLALAFAEMHGERLRFCHHAQHWFEWNGSIWKMQETQLGYRLAREICRAAAFRLNPDEKEKKTLSKASTAAAVERMAKADPGLAVESSAWDRDGWLLGTPSGTVDLRTGELRPSRQEDLITRTTAVTPAPKGTPHPVWDAFLSQATGGAVLGDTEEARKTRAESPDLIAFLWRLVGYCLTGDVTEEILAFLYGEGGTGKGTFIGTIAAIMGDYAVPVPIEVFTAGSKLNLEYYRAQMSSARLVTASETEAGATWAESQIKELTGNETKLSARQPYGKAFSFWPRFKLVLIGNHAPKLKGRSKAMERRLRIAPFKHLPSKEDGSLKERLRAEYPAILRSMIDGCLAWQAQRLGTCDAVKAEGEAYFEQQDHFGRWLAERCTTHSTLSEKPSKLHADFLAWCRENNELLATTNEFRELIERTPGLRYSRGGGIQTVKGIGLAPSQADLAAGHSRYGGS